MGLRKSASPCFTLLLPFISHLSSSSLMHLFIRWGLLYSFEDIFFFMLNSPTHVFPLTVAPGQHACVCACIYKFVAQCFSSEKKLNPKSYYSTKM